MLYTINRYHFVDYTSMKLGEKSYVHLLVRLKSSINENVINFRPEEDTFSSLHSKGFPYYCQQCFS